MTVAAEPFELNLESQKGKSSLHYTKRRFGYVENARVDAGQKEVRELYDLFLSCHISEIVMFQDSKCEARSGCNLRLTCASDETSEEVVVLLSDAGNTFVTDKWLPTWELLTTAIRSWTEHLLERHTISFDVLLESALLSKTFDLKLNDVKALELTEVPIRFMAEGQKIALHATEGLQQMKLVIDGKEFSTDVRLRQGKTFCLSYDPSFQVSAFTVAEPVENDPRHNAEGGGCVDACMALFTRWRRERFQPLAEEQEAGVVQCFPSEEEIERNNPSFTMRLSDENAEECFMRLRDHTGSHVVIDCANLTDALSAGLVQALRSNRHIIYLSFPNQSLQPRDLASLLTGRALVSLRGARLCPNLLHALRAGPSPRELGLSANQLDRPANVQLLEGVLAVPALQSLDLSNNDLGSRDDTIRQLDHALRSQETLHMLYLRRNNLKPKGMCSVLDCLSDKEDSQLRGLFLRGNLIGVESVRRIANWMVHGKARLRFLELAQNQLNEEAAFQVARIVHAMPKQDKLIHLDISGNPDMPLAYVAQALLWNNSLRTLDLSGNMLDREACRQLATALVDNLTLTTLRLASTNIDDDSFSFFLAPSIQVNATLRTLDLSLNKLGAKFCQTMATVFSSNRGLRHVVLNGNVIESDGAIMMLENIAINRDSAMQRLSLSRNLLSDSRIERLMQLLHGRSPLREIEIEGNPVAHHRLLAQVNGTIRVIK